jgi:hypothetical protein
MAGDASIRETNGNEIPLHGGCEDSIGDHCRIGVVTISDRASAGVYEDKSGPAIVQVCARLLLDVP